MPSYPLPPPCIFVHPRTPAAPDNPVLDITTTGNFTAGNPLTVTCTATLRQPLRAPLVIVVLGPNGQEIQNGTVEGVTVALSSPNTGVLKFVPLRTNHGGMYTFRAIVDVSLAEIFISSNQTQDVSVQSQYYEYCLHC